MNVHKFIHINYVSSIGPRQQLMPRGGPGGWNKKVFLRTDTIYHI